MEAWVVLKYLHILAVVTALGANLTYLFWMGRAADNPRELVFVIESVRRLDRRVANPSYILAAVFGAGVVVAGPYTFETGWILVAILLYGLVAALGITLYAPAMRRQLALAREAPGSADYAAAAARSRTLFFVVLAIVLVIVWLMVTKPSLG